MKKFTVIILLCLVALGAYAQKFDKDYKDKIYGMKVGYITEKVGLTASESEKFWPIYNDYSQQRRDIAHKMRDIFKRVEAGAAQDNDLVLLFALQDQETNLMRSSAEKFKSVIAPAKVVKVFVAEESFKRFLMNQRGK